MNLRNIALSSALLLALCGFAFAQDDQLPQPAPYPNQGYYGQYTGDAAYQHGFQDGLMDGQKDRASNHAFRPTGTEKYEDAPGYDKSYGDKKQYKRMYQSGYPAGYQQGYNGIAQAQYPVYGPQGPVYGPYGASPVYAPPTYANQPGYQQGFQDGINDGQQDRQSGHAFRGMATSKYEHTPGYDSSLGDKEQFKQSYRQGYLAGYEQSYGANAPYGQPAYPVYGSQGYPVYGQPPYASNQAYQIGFQDGVNDGRNDRQSGKAYRATNTENYEDAPGYNKALGDKSTYKAAYRQGYAAGYQTGFNGPLR